MQIVTGRRGEPHVTSRQMQAVYRSFLGDFALLDIGEKLRAEAYSNDIVRVYDGVVSVQGIYAVIAYNQYDEVYIEPVSVGKKRIDTIVLHYTKDNTLDVEDMQLDVVQGDEYTDNPIAPVVPEGGDAWEGTTDIQVPIYDVEVTNFGLTVTPYVRMLTVIPTLESIAERIPETFVTGVKGDSEVSYRDGNVNITKTNIGLGNVDNTADTDKPISTATQTALNLKADLTYVDAKIAAAYHAGGSKTVAELTSALLITENMGKVYNMSDSGVTTSDFVEGAGKSIIEGDNVGICNVGTEENPVYKFDLLSGFVDLSAYATTAAVNAGLEGKVDKVTGKGLSTEDYTTSDKTKLAGIEAQANKTVVDSSMSTTSENPLQNKVITAELQGAKTATGNPLTVTNAAPVNAVNLSMDLEPIQDLHGYDHPWVGGAGKNKLNYTNFIAVYNATVNKNNNEVSISGSDARTGATMTDTRLNNLAAGIYTLSFDVVSLTNYQNQPTFFGFIIKKADSSYVYQHVSANQVGTKTLTITLAAGDKIERMDFNINDQVTALSSVCTIVVSNIQVEAGSQATSYADYENICPISGRTEEIITQKDNPTNPTVTKTYTIQFGQTVYGAHVDVTKGELVVDTAKWTANTSTMNNTEEFPGWTGAGIRTLIDDRVDATLDNQTMNVGTSLGINTTESYDIVYLPTTAYGKNQTEWKALAQDVEVIVELATPITIPLTPQQIKLLENTNTIYTDYEGDTITIEYQPNNAIGEAVRVVEESYDAIIQNLIDRITALENS